MTPHTLEEQKALLTAEAEGKVIFWIDEDGKRRFRNDLGEWHFYLHRYEVERPLMERWVNEYSRPDIDMAHPTEQSARESAGPSALRIAVHLREVR